jgi:hypothetical protein
VDQTLALPAEFHAEDSETAEFSGQGVGQFVNHHRQRREQGNREDKMKEDPFKENVAVPGQTHHNGDGPQSHPKKDPALFRLLALLRTGRAKWFPLHPEGFARLREGLPGFRLRATTITRLRHRKWSTKLRPRNQFDYFPDKLHQSPLLG